MLLQGTRTAQRPNSAGNDRITVRPVEPAEATPAPAMPVVRGTYAPISWEHPSLGKVVVEGVGGIARTTVMLVLLAAVLMGTAMAIAVVITSIIQGVGVDASVSY
jgi:hypothetical protein